MTLTFSGHLDDATSPAEQRDWAAIFKGHSSRVTGLCRHMLRNESMAQDAASEVFLRIRSAMGTYDGSVPLERWLLRITANYCIDVIRRRRLERRWISSDETLPDPPGGAATPLTLLLLKERREAVERSMGQLDDSYRIPLVLRYYAGLSYDEIATELVIEKSQVAGRIFRAKQILRVMLKETV
jgi:RNA polymerase sigma-70 factor (ECF subfamily)